jgi:hypothetical protein
VRSEACARAAHIREALTGYRSGHAETALPGEPRAAYKPGVPKGKRLAAKADELGRGLRTIERWASDYLENGESGLISAKSVQPDLGSARFGVFEQTALEIMVEHTDLSKPTKHHIIAHACARIEKTYGQGVVPVPSDSRAYVNLTAAYCLSCWTATCLVSRSQYSWQFSQSTWHSPDWPPILTATGISKMVLKRPGESGALHGGPSGRHESAYELPVEYCR